MTKKSPRATPAFIKAQALCCITTKDGTQKYLRYGVLHNDAGPALITKNGSQEWWVDGKRHRDDDLPAVMHANGNQIWYVNGVRHRDRGPAVICANGVKIWYRDGNRLDALALKSFDPVRLRKLKPKL